MADIAEQICLAIDEIVSQRLRSIRADITVTAEIADNTDAAQGKYICSTGTAQFVAFATDTSYKIGDSVQVTVPNGNYDEQKTIIGKYIKTDNEGVPYVYESSFDRLIDASGNLLAVSPQELPSPTVAGLIANDTDKFEIPVWSWVLSSDSPHVGYTRLGLKGQFRSLLQNYSPISGDYGYRLEVVSCKESTTTSVDKDEVLLALNLYQDIIKNQNTLTWQERVENIPDTWYENWLLEINKNADLASSIKQLLGFKEEDVLDDGKRAYSEILNLDLSNSQHQSVQRQTTRLLLAANALLSNIKLDSKNMFGNPYNFQSFFEQERVFDISSVGEIYGYVLYFYETPQSFKYINKQGEEDYIPVPVDSFNEPTNQPNLYSKDPYICLGYDVSEFDTEKIILYTINGNTYNVNSEDSKKLIRLRWIHKTDSGIAQMTEEDLADIEYEIRWYQYSLGVASADAYSGVYWKRVAENDTKSLMFGFTPDTNLQQEQIKAILFYTDEDGNQQIIRSNILTFTNEQEVPNQATIEAIKGLSIICLDDRNGNYFCYGQDGRFLETEKLSTNTVLKVKPQFVTSNGKTDIKNNAVKWYFPIDNTMLKVYNENGDWAEGQEDDAGWYILEGHVNAEYTLASRYTASYINNTIKCEVTINGRVYSTTKDFHFGSVGTSGTDVTLIIDLSDVALTDTDSEEALDSIIATARLYDSSYSEIDLHDLSDKKNFSIEWAWFPDESSAANKTGDYIEIVLPEENKDKSTFCTLKAKKTMLRWFGFLSILQVTITGWGNYDLTAYKSIPIRKDKTYVGALATTEVIYDSAGYSSYPTYYKEKHELYQTTTEGIKTVNASWGIYNPYLEETKYLGVMESGVFKPAAFYIDNVNQYGSVAFDIDVDIVDPAWIQPIVTLQNHYPSAVTNNWNGTSLELNEDNSTILAAAIAAGKKESDNTFTGVMLGNWKGTNTEDSITENTGVYGFHHGAQSYAFKDDGTAFIGKSGKGRILFNGDKGTIESESWQDKDNQIGMCIDLDDGDIQMINNGYITLSAKQTTYPLSIGSDKDISSRNFKVEWNGTCHAINGEFSGSIDAETGSLGSLSVYGNIELGTRAGSISSGKLELEDYDNSGFWLDKYGFHIGNSKNLYYNNLISSIFYNNGSKMKITGGGIELFSAANAKTAIEESKENSEDTSFAQLGWDSSDDAAYVYLRLGQGTNNSGSGGIKNAGIIKKYSKGLWIGNNDTSDTWENGYMTNPDEGIGIFINITDGGIYYSDSKSETVTKELGIAYFA